MIFMKNRLFGFIVVVLAGFLITGCETEDNDCKPVLKEDCVCPQVYDPVCGCDGITYGNACIASCNSVSSTKGECKFDKSFIVGDWSFVGYKESEKISGLVSKHGYDINILFSEKDGNYSVSGKSSINLYNGTYIVMSNKDGKGLISIEGFLTTKVGGSPKDLDYEYRYTENLRNVQSYSLIDKNVIHFQVVNGDFKDIMIFKRK